MFFFWICSAVLTVGVIVALTRPLMSRPATAGSNDTADRSDLAVYRDQLREIEADKERGLLAGPEAEAARVEVARRLLTRAKELDAASDAPGSGAKTPADIRLFYVIAGAVPALSLLLYLGLGTPSLPGLPFAQRQAQSQQASNDIEAMIAKVEARLRENPSEGQGWEVLAPVYLKLDRFADAANAFQRALELLGPEPRRLAGFAEATVLANNGVVVESARRAYQKMLELDPGRPEARFGLALAKEQDGELTQAEADYRALLADAPPDAQWREFILARLDGLAERRGQPKPSASQPAPSGPAADVVAKLPPAERQAVIMQMVEGLEAKLKANGRDLDGWQRLMRSWSVLGRKEKALAALLDARKAFTGDQQSLLEINAFAKSLGLES